MSEFTLRLCFIFLGATSILWGGLIVFSKKYFEYWQNTHWAEPDNNQWSKDSARSNKFGVGLGALLFGIAIVWFALFKM